MTFTSWKVAVFGVFLVCIFAHFDRIRRDTKYLSIFSISPYLVWTRENTDQKKSVYAHFPRSVSSGNEPVSMWVPLRDIHTKSRVLATIRFRVIISIDLITTLGSVGWYTACKVKNANEKPAVFTGEWWLLDAGDTHLMRMSWNYSYPFTADKISWSWVNFS